MTSVVFTQVRGHCLETVGATTGEFKRALTLLSLLCHLQLPFPIFTFHKKLNVNCYADLSLCIPQPNQFVTLWREPYIVCEVKF